MKVFSFFFFFFERESEQIAFQQHVAVDCLLLMTDTELHVLYWSKWKPNFEKFVSLDGPVELECLSSDSGSSKS